jgi:hypothetical protein
MIRWVSELLRARASTLLAVTVLLLTSPAYAVGVSPGSATPVQREQAQAMFMHGKALYDAKKYGDALAAFRSSMDIVASPNSRLYVARCLRESGKLVEAYVEFDRTAVEANEHAREDSRYARTGASARTERDAVAPNIGFLLVHVDHATAATTLRVTGEEIRQAGWGEPVPVTPGDTEVVVETPPSSPTHRTVTLAAGEKKTVVIDAAPAPTELAAAPQTSRDPRSLRTYAYVAGGVGVAGLLTFAIAGILSDSTYSDLSSTCHNRPCPSSKQSEVSTGQAQQTAADVGLGFAIVGLGIGATLFVLSLPPKTRGPEESSPPAVTVSLGPGSASLRGSF